MEKMPQREKFDTESSKQDLWEKQISLLEEIGKDDLPIDNKELIETVAALNINGITTIASNAGHAIEERHTGDTAYPWILIYNNENTDTGVSVYTNTENALSEFYKSRKVAEDVRLRTDLFEDQITLSSVDKNIRQKDSNGELTQEDRDELIKLLPERQQEMYGFGQFLKTKFFVD